MTFDPGFHSMTVSNISLETTGPTVTKFDEEPSGVEGTKFIQMVRTHDQHDSHAPLKTDGLVTLYVASGT